MSGFTRSLVIAIVSVGLIVGTGFIVGTFAQGTYDQTAPLLTVDVRPAFVVGNVLTALKYVDDATDPPETVWYTDNITEFTRFSATDDSGICEWIVLDLHGFVTTYQTPTLTDSYGTATDYDGRFGGWTPGPDGGLGGGFQITALDCSLPQLGVRAGNSTSKVVQNVVTVNQEDGTTDGSQGPSGHFTYKGAWASTDCDCLGGKAARSTIQGNRMTFTRTYEGGDHVALVMSEGPGRGVIAIRIDDKWLMNLDTYAPADANRVVVFDRQMTAGTHTVAIVNQATPGRPEVIFDAVMTN
jgi:hypothetical protein